MRLLADIRWGIPFGLRILSKLALCLSLPYVMFGDRWLTRLGVSFGELVAVSVSGGIAVGFILAILRPMTRWRAGAILVGVIVALIGFGATLTLVSRTPTNWSLANWIGVTIAGLVVGTFAGNLAWQESIFSPPPENP